MCIMFLLPNTILPLDCIVTLYSLTADFKPYRGGRLYPLIVNSHSKQSVREHALICVSYSHHTTVQQTNHPQADIQSSYTEGKSNKITNKGCENRWTYLSSPISFRQIYFYHNEQSGELQLIQY